MPHGLTVGISKIIIFNLSLCVRSVLSAIPTQGNCAERELSRLAQKELRKKLCLALKVDSRAC